MSTPGANEREPLSLKDLVITSTTETFDEAKRTSPKNEGDAVFLENNELPSQAGPILARPEDMALPVTLTRSFQISLSTEGSESQTIIPTDCFIQLFGDRVVMGISQVKGKIGNYLLCQVQPSPVKPQAFDFEVSNLLGAREDPLLAVFARRICEQVIVPRLPPMESFTLILGISLQPNSQGRDPQVFRSTVDIMGKLYAEASNLAN